MEWGMKNRMSRMIKPDSGRIVMLAVDHGYFQGPTTGLQNLKGTIDPLLPYADTLMITRGMLRICVDPNNDVPVMLRVSGGNSVLTELSNEGLTCDIEDAIRLNVCGITLSIFVGSPGEHQTLLNLGKLADWGNRYGIPVMAVTAVGREMARDARYLGLCCRMAVEIGSHMVKTYYCENFSKIIAATPVPVVIAGGKKIPEKDALEMAAKAVGDGAAGVDMGRNVFQSDSPVAMIQAIRAVVHKNLPAGQAYEMYQDLKASEK
jgi:3-hydroxy-5-phosphonooxypentane-2,4-dione thiolase